MAGEDRGQGDRPDDLGLDELLDIVVVRRAQRVAMLAVRRPGQYDDAIQAAELVVEILQHALDGFRAQGIDLLHVDGLRADRLGPGASHADRVERAETHDDLRAAVDVRIGEGEGFVDIGAAEDQHGVAAQVDEPVVGPGDQF